MGTAANQHLPFDKYAQEAQAFLNKLSEDLGHKEEKQRTLIILRAVLHTVRDRITIAESFDEPSAPSARAD